MDAFRVIITSGYIMSQDDFFEIVQILSMKKAVSTLNRRNQVVSFFTEVAKILEFDVQKVEETIAY